MKKLFKSVAIVAAAIFATVSASAQVEVSKETVIVEPFTFSKSKSITEVERDNLRSAVMSGFSKVGRFHTVDALTDARLSQLFEQRSYEDVVNDTNWQTESASAYKALNANKIIKGHLELIYKYIKKNDEGKNVYHCDVNFTLQVFSLVDGTMVGSESYKFQELSLSSYTDAFNSAIRKTSKDMTQFCNKYFKMQSCVLELESDKKGAVSRVVVSGGSEMGISNGTIFKVMIEKKYGPKVTRVQVGQVVAKEVLEGVTICNVMNKKEGDVLKQYFNEGQTLYVELDRKRGDDLKAFGRMLGF
ncbi:MAG: hypothetical protein IKV09_00650 [Alistipes sp.]|nr:hypothetical protein [Alistipes sp.]